jgi:FlaA1/EpsC-like NDP-sugar epimerase
MIRDIREDTHRERRNGPAQVAQPQTAERGRLERLQAAFVQRCSHLGVQLARPNIWLMAAVHALVFAGVYWLAYSFRFDFAMPEDFAALFRASLGWVLGIQLLVFFFLGQLQGWWRYVTFADLIALLRASLLSLVILAATTFFFRAFYGIPRLVLILDCILLIVALGALRAVWRIIREMAWPVLGGNEYRGALLVGTDLSSGILAHQIQSSGPLSYRIRGLLATDGAARSTQLGQIPILGKLDDVGEIAAAADATDVLVVAGTLAGQRLRKLMRACEEHELTLKIIRPLEDRLGGDRRIPVRDIEINDLLSRDPVTLDSENIGRLLTGRKVMVTGAGGSIGSEICRQIMKFEPACLILVGRGENRIFHIERELRRHHPSAKLHACIADVANPKRMLHVFESYRPEVVFHAAAHKHVPLMEANVSEAVRNNVFGTKCVADLAHRFGVNRFVMVSTDKAVRPSSIMGATKQVAERYVYSLSQESATRFTAVRFGNVLGSTGSVVPIFQEQIRRGGPITITDPRMTRFFMTVPEASQLVLQAATMGRGGEIFTLEMGEPVRIIDLAHDLVRLSGLPSHAIEIVVTGVRRGEKLHEELYFEDEETLPTSHDKIRAAYHRPYDLVEVADAIRELNTLLDGPEDVLRQKLREIVPEFQSPETGNGDAQPPQAPQAGIKSGAEAIA